MAPLIVGLGYDWAIAQTAKCIGELVGLVRPEGDGGLFSRTDVPPVTITCKPGDSLDHVEDASVDVVVMDPAVLRQRDVRRAVRFLLRLAQAHCRSPVPGAVPSPADRQGE